MVASEGGPESGKSHTEPLQKLAGSFMSIQTPSKRHGGKERCQLTMPVRVSVPVQKVWKVHSARPGLHKREISTDVSRGYQFHARIKGQYGVNTLTYTIRQLAVTLV